MGIYIYPTSRDYFNLSGGTVTGQTNFTGNLSATTYYSGTTELGVIFNNIINNISSGGTGTSGYSGYSGPQGGSGFSGYSGYSGPSGFSGYSGYSGFSGYSGIGTSGFSGYSGNSTSGFSGYSGIGTSGFSGYSGYSGSSGFSGYSGYSGISGFSGYSAYSGYSGFSGYSGYSGPSGFSGYSGYSGPSGFSGYSGYSGISGFSGYSAYSGYSGFSGYSGYSGPSGFSGYSGYSGPSGFSGYSGYSGISGFSGYSAYSGYSGFSGYSGYSGPSGFSGYSGYSGSSGFSGYSGNGLSGFSGYSGGGGSPIIISNGLNTYTGNTASNPTINVSGLTVDNFIVSGSTYLNGSSTFVGGRLVLNSSTAPQIRYSGDTTLTGFHFDGGDVISLHTNNKQRLVALSGGTIGINLETNNVNGNYKLHVSGNTLFDNGITAQTISATTIYSGNTNLENIFLTSGSTSGIGTSIFINKTGSVLSFKSLSAGTNVTLSDDGSNITINSSGGPGGASTYVSNGLNTYTGGTASNPTVNVSGLTIENIYVSGSSIFNSLSAQTLSAGTIYSGSTELGTLFGSASIVNLQTLQLNTKVNRSGDTMTGTLYLPSISGTSISGETINSGTTNINELFAHKAHYHAGGIGFIIDGNQQEITSGFKGHIILAYSGLIQSWTVLSDVSGITSIDVYKNNFSNYPPTISDSITGSEKITLNSQMKNQNNSIVTWNKTFNTGDIFGFNVDSASTVTRLTVLINTLKYY